VVREEAETTERLEIASAADVLRLPGTVQRDVLDRRNVVVEHPALAPLRFYLKVLRSRGIDRLLPGTPRAVRELHRLLEFRSHGIEVPRPVLAGSARGMSFLLTRAVEPAVPLDDWLVGAERKSLRVRRALESVARITARMHTRGLFHRDLYLCHFLRREDGGLVLLDVERSLSHPWRVRRWRIKDLAALSSSLGSVVSRADRLRGLKEYLRSAAPGLDIRPLLRAVRKKELRILAHVPRKARETSR